MRVRWVSHTWKNTQWNVSLFESSDKCPYWTNPYHMGFRYEASLNFHTYFGQCPNDTYILLHMPLHACPNYTHTGLTTTTAPSGHQMAVVTWDRCIASLSSIGILGANFSESWIGILSFSFKKMHLKMSLARMAAILSRTRWITACMMGWSRLGMWWDNPLSVWQPLTPAIGLKFVCV